MSSLGSERFADEFAKVLSKASWNLRELGLQDRHQKAEDKTELYIPREEISKISLIDRRDGRWNIKEKRKK